MMAMAGVNSLNLREITAEVCNIAREASLRILEIYDSDFSISRKDDRSPLTAADMASHDTICALLEKFDPAIPILSEESASIPYAGRKRWQRYWLVDPLDGTREFVKRNGEFTVNIALIEQHQPVIGVVEVPVSGITYFASRGNGAFKQESNKAPEALKARKTKMDKITIAGSRSHGSAKQQAFIDRMKAAEVIAIGSALKFCLVAEGRVDIYPRFGPTSEWDTAAAQCIVEEAGGIVTDTDFQPLRYNTRESLVNSSFLAIADPSFDWRPYLAE